MQIIDEAIKMHDNKMRIMRIDFFFLIEEK